MLQRSVGKWMAVWLAVLALGLGAAAPAAAEEAGLWAALEKGEAVAIMRHALAPGTGDPADFALGDCDTQRNLSAEGRAQAQAIGAAFRAAGIARARVLTSRWCRCRDTARLLDLGEVEAYPTIDSFFEDRDNGPGQTAALRDFLAQLPAGEPTVMVTHQVNITALTGVFPRSGEIVFVRAQADGTVTTLGSLLPE